MVAARTPDIAVYHASSAVTMPSQPPIWIHVVPSDPLALTHHPMVNPRKVRDRKANTAMRAPLLLNVLRNIITVKIVHPRRKAVSPEATAFSAVRAARIPVGGKSTKPRAIQKPPNHRRSRRLLHQRCCPP